MARTVFLRMSFLDCPKLRSEYVWLHAIDVICSTHPRSPYLLWLESIPNSITRTTDHSLLGRLSERMNISYLSILLILVHLLSIQAYILGMEHRNEWDVQKVDATSLDGVNQTTALEGE